MRLYNLFRVDDFLCIKFSKFSIRKKIFLLKKKLVPLIDTGIIFRLGLIILILFRKNIKCIFFIIISLKIENSVKIFFKRLFLKK